MGVWENRQGTGVGSCNLPQVTDQTAQDLSPRRTAAGLRAGGPRRGKGNHQSRPKEVTHGQKTEVAGQGPVSCMGDGLTAAKGWPASQTGEAKQRGSWPPRQTDRQPCGCQSRAGRSRQTVGPRALRSLSRETPGGPPEAVPANPDPPRAQGGEEGEDVVSRSPGPAHRAAGSSPRERERGGRGPGPRARPTAHQRSPARKPFGATGVTFASCGRVTRPPQASQS